MSINYATDTGVFNGKRTVPLPDAILPFAEPTLYTRPADWLTLPTISPGDQVAYMLNAVTDDESNWTTIFCVTSGSGFTVDWGDGTAPQSYSNSSNAQYNYDFASISSGTLTSRGYKQVIVTVTPTSGNITQFNLGKKYVSTTGGTVNTYSTKWLDISLQLNFLSNLYFSTDAGSNTIYARYLEQVSVTATGLASLNYTFAGCEVLQSITALNINPALNGLTSTFNNCRLLEQTPVLTSTVTGAVSAFNLFNGCTNLKYVPDMDFFVGGSGGLTNMFLGCASLERAPNIKFHSTSNATINMFNNCYKLKYVPNYNLPGLISASAMFQNCKTLIEAPYLDTKLVTSADSMFNGCTSLRVFPSYDLSSATNTISMFNGCVSLEFIPSLNLTANNINASQMFSNNTSLKEIGSINIANVSNTDSFFNACSSLQSLPVLDLNKNTSANTMFQNCQSLQTITLANTGNIVNFSSTFASCLSLEEVDLLDTTSNVTNMISTFSGCTNLKTLPSNTILNTSKVTSMNSAFVTCATLESVPLYNTINVASFTSTFSGCATLKEVPLFNTSNGTGFNNMFNACLVLQSVPLLDSTKVTTVATMFQNASALSSIPAFNLSNVTTGTSFAASTSSLASSSVTGLRVTTAYNNCNLQKNALETIFLNLGTNPSTQTITISSNPGADFTTRVGLGITAGSNVITMSSTLGLTVGQYVYGTGVNTGIPVTFNAAADTVVYTQGGGLNGLANGDTVMFTAITPSNGLSAGVPYYVVNRTSTTFQVSTTVGGGAFNITINGTGVMSIGGATTSNQIVTVNTNANVIIAGRNGLTNASSTLVTRYLNTNQAVTKNWTVTG